MLLLALLKGLFSLNTLDTRFTTVSTRPKQNPGPNSNGTRGPREVTGTPSKWNTIEFYSYYLLLAIAIPLMFKVTYELSTGRLQTCLFHTG